MSAESFFSYALGVVGGLAVIVLGYMAYKTVESNGETDYCYVEMWSPPQMAPQWMLSAHRPWRVDRQIGVYPSLEDAKSKSDSLGCKLGSK
jgi:hypothetical protein